MEVLEAGGGGGGVSGSEVGMADQGEGVVLSWGQVDGSTADDALVIADEELEGEDAEVITAFSGKELRKEGVNNYMYITCMYICNDNPSII